jgi:hypothetical protein
VGEVQARVSAREPEVGTGVMVRHGSSTPLRQMLRTTSATWPAEMVFQPIYNVARLIEATLHRSSMFEASTV